MSRAPKARDERTRTFTGCRTCRTRHAKCDETQPACRVCRRLGLECGGYVPSLHWVTEDVNAATDTRTHVIRGSGVRFQLFTESERRNMSNQMSSAMSMGTSVDCTLAHLDMLCDKRIERSEDGSTFSPISHGPFAVFRAPKQSLSKQTPVFSGSYIETSLPDALPEDPCHDNVEDFADLDAEEQFHVLDWSRAPPYLDLGLVPEPFVEDNDHTGSLDDGSYMCDIPSWGLNIDLSSVLGPAVVSDEAEQVTGEASITGSKGCPSIFEQESQPIVEKTQPKQHNSNHPNALSFDPRDGFKSSPLSVLSLHQTGSNMPQHTQFLLRYYRQHLSKTASWMPHNRQSPWQVIFLPCALETFSELAIWDTTSDTRFAILSTLLAQSAFLLHRSGTMSTDDSIQKVGVSHLKKAQDHLRKSLAEYMSGAQKTKYEELLMTTLALVMTSLYHTPKLFRSYLYDAERLIRHHGFSNAYPTSETRILHHMYTHLRVMAESFSPGSSKRVTSSSGSGGMALLSSRQFRVTEDSMNTGLDAASEKSFELGLRDIHLQSQGRWLQTMYPAIYGIPESLMTLFSQTVSTANGKDWLEQNQPDNRKVLDSLESHVKTLEQSVWSWTLKEDPPAIGPVKSQHLAYTNEQELLHYDSPRSMTLAIHQALLIYFYRRIHNVNAMLLQDLVKKTFDHVETGLDDMVTDLDFAPSLAWPVFVAACEAMTSVLRGQAARLLEKTNSSSSILVPISAKEVVSQVWEHREETGDMTISWKEVISQVGVC